MAAISKKIEKSAWTANEENVFAAGLLHYGR
jgi:hypothetical protein